MKLHEVQYKVLELTKSATPGEGLYWDGCTTKDGLPKFPSADNAIRDAVTQRMIRPDVDASGEQYAADLKVLDNCRKWNPELQLDGVTKMLDFAVQQAWADLTVPDKTSHVQKQTLRKVAAKATPNLPV